MYHQQALGDVDFSSVLNSLTQAYGASQAVKAAEAQRRAAAAAAAAAPLVQSAYPVRVPLPSSGVILGAGALAALGLVAFAMRGGRRRRR